MNLTDRRKFGISPNDVPGRLDPAVFSFRIVWFDAEDYAHPRVEFRGKQRYRDMVHEDGVAADVVVRREDYDRVGKTGLHQCGWNRRDGSSIRRLKQEVRRCTPTKERRVELLLVTVQHRNCFRRRDYKRYSAFRLFEQCRTLEQRTKLFCNVVAECSTGARTQSNSVSTGKNYSGTTCSIELRRHKQVPQAQEARQPYVLIARTKGARIKARAMCSPGIAFLK
jgi:hypothetical protein